MDSQKLNDWMQVAGIFAVVASLIFVGLQMKQSQEIAIAAQYQERAALGMEYFISTEQNEHSLRRTGETEMANHGLPPGMLDGSTPEEVGSRIINVRKSLLIYDNHHFQYESGFLTDESWMRFRNRLKGSLAQPIYQHVIEHSNSRSSFRAVCDQIISELSQESE